MHARHTVLTLAVVAAVALGCAPEGTTSFSGGGGDAPFVVLDMGHGETLDPEDGSPLGLSEAAALIREAGFDVRVNQGLFDDSVLEGASGVILPGPSEALAVPEQNALDEYVAHGGVLVIATHLPVPVREIAGHFGLQLSNGVVLSENPLDDDAGVFATGEIVSDPLTEDVTSVRVETAWAVNVAVEEGRAIVLSGEDTWMDLDRDRQRGEDDRAGPLALVAVVQAGDGVVVLLGDDGILSNTGIGEADNARLFENVLRLMAEEGGAS